LAEPAAAEHVVATANKPGEDDATPPSVEPSMPTDAARDTAGGSTTHWAMPKSVLPYALGGVGVAALAAGGLLTYWGNKDNSDLQSQCRPRCPPDSGNHVHTLYIASDVAWGVGAATLGLTALLFATSRSKEAVPRPAPVAVDVHPTSTGAFGTITGAF